MDKLEKFKQILQILQNDTITPNEVKKFLGLLVEIVKQSREKNDANAIECTRVMETCLSQLKYDFKTVLNETELANSTYLTTVTSKINTLQAMIDEINSMEIKDGEDGEDSDPEMVIEEVLKRIPKQKKIKLDTPIQIVEKLEMLEDDNTIGGGVTQIKVAGGISMTSTGSNGRGVVTLTGSGGGNFETPTGDIDGVNDTFTVLNIPKAIVINGVWYFENDGYTFDIPNSTIIPPTGSTLRSFY